GNNIRAIAWGGNSEWYIVGNSAKINAYNGSTFTDLSNSLTGWGSNNILTIADGSGTENFWLFGGGASGVGKLTKYDGTTFTNLESTAGFFGNTYTVYSLAFNGTYWLIGGSQGRLSRYSGGTFTDLSFLLDGSGAGQGNFGSNNVYAIDWDSTNSVWLIGGSGGKLASYNGSTFTDRSASVSTFNNIYSLHHDGNYWMLVGNDTGGNTECYSWDGSIFRDLSSSLENMGASLPFYSITGNGTTWLMGGAQAKVNDHTGGASSTTFNDRSNRLADFGTKDIMACAYNSTNGYWLVGGADKALNSYNGTSFTDISSHLAGFAATDDVLSVGYNGTYWLIGGTGGKFSRYNGTSGTDLSTNLGFGSNAVYAVEWNSTNSEWLIGGAGPSLKTYNGASFSSDLSSSMSSFTGNIRAICYSGGWYIIGGTSGSINRYNRTTFSNLASSWGSEDVFAIDSNGSEFLVGGSNATCKRLIP
ncbi:hypothetical protein K8S19_06615, partial [bacterium]|nr:hypothetical protein [bacterium]